MEEAAPVILVGTAREQLRTLPERSVQTCITSPPYFGLRDYGTAEWEGGDEGCDHKGPPQQSQASTLKGTGHGGGKPLSPSLQAQSQPFRDVCGKCGARRVDKQLGLEATPAEYVQALVDVFREVRRVLRDDGTVFLVIGDSYGEGKQLQGIPWRVAFAMQADGWVLRQEIIWQKPSTMPESVTDRCTRSHEQVFMLAKRANYFYDADAIREPHDRIEKWGFAADGLLPHEREGRTDNRPRDAALIADGTMHGGGGFRTALNPAGRNKRSVWTVATKPYPDAHFAVFPPKLVEPMVLAGSRPGDVVLDPFCGTATTGEVAIQNGRGFVGIELNPEYAELARRRLVGVTAPLFA